MAYQCKEPCLPPPIDVVTQCPVDAQEFCPSTSMAQGIHTCDCLPSEACGAPGSFSYQAKEASPAPFFGAPLCPLAIAIPCGLPGLSLHTEMGAGSSSVPCGSSSETADTCARPSSPPTCGSSCSGNCSDSQGGGETPYVRPGSTVCLKPSGSILVKPAASSPKREGNSVFLASYKPHFI